MTDTPEKIAIARWVAVTALPDYRGHEALAMHLFSVAAMDVDAIAATLAAARKSTIAAATHDAADDYEERRMTGAMVTGSFSAPASRDQARRGWSKAMKT